MMLCQHTISNARLQAGLPAGPNLRAGAGVASVVTVAGLVSIWVGIALADPRTEPQTLLLHSLAVLLIAILVWSSGARARHSAAHAARYAGLGLAASGAIVCGLALTSDVFDATDQPSALILAVIVFLLGTLLAALPRSRQGEKADRGPAHAVDPLLRGGSAMRAETKTTDPGAQTPPSGWARPLDGVALFVVLLGNSLLLMLTFTVIGHTADSEGFSPFVGGWQGPCLGIPLLLLLGHQVILVRIGLSRHRGATALSAGIVLAAGFIVVAALAIDGPKGGHACSLIFASVALLGTAALYIAARRTRPLPHRQAAITTSPVRLPDEDAASNLPLADRLKDLLGIWLATPGFIVCAYALAFGLAGALYLAGQDDLSLYELAWYEAEFLALWVVLLFVVRRPGRSWGWLGFKPFDLRYLVLVPLVIAFDSGVAAITGGLLIPSSPAVSQYQAELDPVIEPSAATIFLLFFGSVVVAPVVEETLFRGCVFTGFSTYMSPRSAALVSALLFSLIHFIPSFDPFRIDLHPGQALGAFVGGLLYAGLRHESDSLFPSIIAHGAWNLLVISN
jgi:hypothetical protein